MSAIYWFGEFTFDCESCRLWRDGEVLHLSPKAQQLLRILLEARPRVVTRQELYDALWPSTFVCETNLAGIVNELRRVLDDNAREAQYIRTVHRVGYAFNGQVGSVKPALGAMVTLLCESQEYPLYEGRSVIGRDQNCDIVLSNRTVSRRHAAITFTNGVIVIEDLQSKNGTFVDGSRTTRANVTRHNRIEFGAVAAKIVSQKISSTASLRLGIVAATGSPNRRTSSPAARS